MKLVHAVSGYAYQLVGDHCDRLRRAVLRAPAASAARRSPIAITDEDFITTWVQMVHGQISPDLRPAQ
jgi:hypothetical protein